MTLPLFRTHARTALALVAQRAPRTALRSQLARWAASCSGGMACVTVTNVAVLDNPARFENPFQFEVSFECIAPIPDDIEWKLTCARPRAFSPTPGLRHPLPRPLT